MEDECEMLIYRNYPILRISLAYANRSLRPKLVGLYGLLATIEEALYRASDPVVSHAKLAWWSEELQHAKRGHGNHPFALQLESSGALAAWPEALIERMFRLAMSRVDASGVKDEHALQQLCESLGLIHLEMEAALQNISVPDGNAVRRLAASNGLLQLFRESYQARAPSFYWVPLSDCARLGIDRITIAGNASDARVRQVFSDITERIFEQGSMIQNIAPLTELSRPWAAQCQHWLLLSLLQQRQLLHLQNEGARPGSTADVKNRFQLVRWSDGWHAWRIVRQLNAGGREGKD